MFNKDIGIDLGTANVLIYIKGQGIVLNEPSVVAIDADTKKPLAVGREAHEMLGRTPGKVKAIKPMQDGVIADFETTEVMLNYFIKKVNGRSFLSRPRILICCPSNITQVEKNAIKEAAERTGAKKVFLEEEPKVVLSETRAAEAKKIAKQLQEEYHKGITKSDYCLPDKAFEDLEYKYVWQPGDAFRIYDPEARQNIGVRYKINKDQVAEPQIPKRPR